MPTFADLPDAVAAFLREHIRTVNDLHLLVAIAEDPDRWWDEASVARELLVDHRAARVVLEHLAAHNVLEIRVTASVRYRYRPGTPELRSAAAACVAAYCEDPLAVWRALARPARRADMRMPRLD